jgi:uncharacterized membrane protein
VTVADRRRLAGLCLALFALYSTYALARHDRYLTTGFDLGIFDQAVRAYSRFEAPIVPLKAPGFHLLGDHFHPVLVVWAPLYWIWDDPRMLLLAQAALIAASAVPVAAFTARRLGSRPALVVAGLYGLSWPLQRMVQFDVHEIAFAIPAIAVVVDGIDRRARWTTLAGCLVLLATREDMGAFVVVVGALVAVRAVRLTGQHRQLRPQRGDLVHGGILVLLGAAGYRLATGVVIPHFSGDAGFVYWTFPALGPDLASAARFAITQPWSVLALLVSPWRKAQTLLALGMPTLYLCLGSRYALLTLPFIAQRMLNSRELLWSTNFHYSSVLAPILFMAAVDAVAGLRAALRRRGASGRPASRMAERLVPVWLSGCAVVLVLGMLVQAGDYPVSRIATVRFWARDLRVQAIDRVLPQLPSDVCVEADNSLAPQLTRRAYVTRIGRSDELATWMVLDFSRNDTGWQGTSPEVAYADALARGFAPVAQDDVIVLLSRPGPVAGVCRVR